MGDLVQIFLFILIVGGLIYFYSRFSELKKEVKEYRMIKIHKMHPDWHEWEREKEYKRGNPASVDNLVAAIFIIVLALSYLFLTTS